MNSKLRFIVVCTAVLVSGIPILGQSPSILESKVERVQGPPLWISAASVADETKTINLDLIDSSPLEANVAHQRQELESRLPAEKSAAHGKPPVLAIPSSECKSSTFIMDDRGGGGLRGSLADLTTYSKSVVRGTVRTVDFGFSFGTPSSLLGVEVSEVVKGPRPKSPFYIDYPIARFKIGPYYFCNTNQGFEPVPGDQVLLFDYTGPVDGNQVLYAPRLDQIFFQSQSGSLFIPTLLRKTPDLKGVQTIEEILDRLRLSYPAESPDVG